MGLLREALSSGAQSRIQVGTVGILRILVRIRLRKNVDRVARLKGHVR